ncbi:hypothetical protein AB9K35_16980 [Leisingera sp. XS_AS12]|uniref:hypothetical protein n=1 Tax=Leisingera sp. XS_AS12 TaxID=3241294 RepID=UPI003514D034
MRATKQERRRHKLEQLIPHLALLDIEASDGGPEAWPVEIGCAAIVRSPDAEGGYEALAHGSLIRPHKSWDQAIWSPYAQAIHGIARESLEDAPAAQSVARSMLEILSVPGTVVVSDSPRNDQPWLDRLMATCGAAGQIRIISIWEALNGRTEQENIARMKDWLKANKGPHRAAADARRLAQAVIECHLQPAAEAEGPSICGP